jgi:hypothetical protein
MSNVNVCVKNAPLGVDKRKRQILGARWLMTAAVRRPRVGRATNKIHRAELAIGNSSNYEQTNGADHFLKRQMT